MPNPHLNSIVVKQFRDATYIGLAKVVGEQHLRFDGLRRIDELLHRHRIGLVAGEEGDVDVFDVSHLGDVLGVTSDVDPQPVKGEDEAIVAPFGVELLVVWGGVVGRDSLNGDVVCQL